MSHSLNERGQTLIELAVVCGVMGLALLITTPSLSGYMRTQKVNKGMDALVSQIDLARQRSITKRVPVEITIKDPEDNQFWSYEDTNSDGGWDAGEPKYGPFTLPVGVTFDENQLQGDSRLVFTPAGVLQAGQGGPISLLDSEGHSLTLNVMASGMAKKL